MESRLILFPLIAMALLTFIVAALMFRRRVAAMKAQRIHPQKVALSAQMAALIADTRASDNFRNLFELPVLFYAAVLTIYSANLCNTTYMVLSWIFVVTRSAHSYLHCGPNRTMLRFSAFAAGFITLILIWLLLAFDMITSAAV